MLLEKDLCEPTAEESDRVGLPDEAILAGHVLNHPGIMPAESDRAPANLPFDFDWDEPIPAGNDSNVEDTLVPC